MEETNNPPASVEQPEQVVKPSLTTITLTKTTKDKLTQFWHELEDPFIIKNYDQLLIEMIETIQSINDK